MNGRAPYWSLTGSHICEVKNFQPNACRESREEEASSKTIRTRRAMMAAPQASMAAWKEPSASRMRKSEIGRIAEALRTIDNFGSETGLSRFNSGICSERFSIATNLSEHCYSNVKM